MNQQSSQFLFSNELDVEDLGGGLKRQILGYNHELMAVKVWFDKGAEGYTHKHRHSQVVYVLDGEFEFSIGDETKTVKAGDSCMIPPNVDHGAVCTTGGILIDMFSPPREDFLKDKL